MALETLYNWERSDGTCIEVISSDNVRTLLKYPEKRNILLGLKTTNKPVNEKMDIHKSFFKKSRISVSSEENPRSPRKRKPFDVIGKGRSCSNVSKEINCYNKEKTDNTTTVTIHEQRTIYITNKNSKKSGKVYLNLKPYFLLVKY